MKKLLLATMLLSIGVMVSAKEVSPKPEEVTPQKQNYVVNMSVGVTPFADYTVKGTTVDGDGAGFDFDLSLMKELKPHWYAGLGFGVHNLNDGVTRLGWHTIGHYEDYKSYPIYLTTKYELFAINGIRPFVKADLGYAFNGAVKYEVMGEKGKEGIDNGIYAGIGFGLEQNNINANLMLKTTQSENDFDNYRMVLSVGYDFDFSL